MEHPKDLTPNYVRVQKTNSVGSIKRVRIFKCHNCEKEYSVSLAALTLKTVYCEPCWVLYLKEQDFTRVAKKVTLPVLLALVRVAVASSKEVTVRAVANELDVEEELLVTMMHKYRKFKHL